MKTGTRLYGDVNNNSGNSVRRWARFLNTTILRSDLLVGNFSFINSGIDAFDPVTGAFRGTIPIDVGIGNTPGGLWALGFGIGGRNGDPNTLTLLTGSVARRTDCSAPYRPSPNPRPGR